MVPRLAAVSPYFKGSMVNIQSVVAAGKVCENFCSKIMSENLFVGMYT